MKYGTSGFRDDAKKIIEISFKIGEIIAYLTTSKNEHLHLFICHFVGKIHFFSLCDRPRSRTKIQRNPLVTGSNADRQQSDFEAKHE